MEPLTTNASSLTYLVCYNVTLRRESVSSVLPLRTWLRISSGLIYWPACLSVVRLLFLPSHSCSCCLFTDERGDNKKTRQGFSDVVDAAAAAVASVDGDPFILLLCRHINVKLSKEKKVHARRIDSVGEGTKKRGIFGSFSICLVFTNCALS